MKEKAINKSKETMTVLYRGQYKENILRFISSKTTISTSLLLW